VIQVRQNVWRGKIQTVKSRKGNRRFPISPELVEHLRGYLQELAAKLAGLLFRNRKRYTVGSQPGSQAKFHPLLKKLGICSVASMLSAMATPPFCDQIGAPMAVR